MVTTNEFITFHKVQDSCYSFMASISSVLTATESSPDFAGFLLSKSYLLRDFESFVLIFYKGNNVLRFMQGLR